VDQPRRVSFGLPRPKKGQIGLMIAIAAIWVFFAVGINWGDAGGDVFGKLVGTADILKGQVWRLFTNVFLQQPSGRGSVGHLLTALLGIYFLGASLEERWGTKRFLMFTIGAAWFASFLQFALATFVSDKLGTVWYGALGMVDAIAVAWAMTFKDRQVQLMFVLPVSGLGLILFTFAMNILYVLAAEDHREGFVTPFAGMLAGYLFADGSPVRKKYLEWRYKNLAKQSVALRSLRTESSPRLRVIEGGGSKRPDKSMLN
jgi:membrane associated rhomboid family serine protease